MTVAGNPKQDFGIRKVPLFSVVPLRVLAGVALAMMEGARKYGAFNYRVVGTIVASVYTDGAARHIAQFCEGEDHDTESKAGLHHLDKAIASLIVLRDAILRGNWEDDRPPRSDPSWITQANQTASMLVDSFPTPVAPYTQIGLLEPSTDE